MKFKQIMLFTVFFIFCFACKKQQKTATKNKEKQIILKNEMLDFSIIDNTSSETLLKSVLKTLQDCNSDLEGVTYKYSTANTLPTNWIIQSSPNDTSCSLMTNIKNTFTNYVKNAPNNKHYIDILQLGDDRKNDEFQLEIIKSITDFANTAQKEIIIRYLEGNPADKKVNKEKYFYFFNELMNAYSGRSNITIYAATFDYPWIDRINGLTPGSWNHAKIIAVDGVVSIVGGQNYWNDYLAPTHIPPHDLSIIVNGEATASAHEFANYLWTYVARPDTQYTTHRTVKLGSKSITQNLPPFFYSSNYPSPTSGNIPILAVGNLGIWGITEFTFLLGEAGVASQVYPKNTSSTNEKAKNILLKYPFAELDLSESKAKQASITARHLILKAVKKNGHIRISQQKIADTDITSETGYVLWPGDFTDAILNALINKNAKVDILVSNDDGGAGGYGDDMGGLALQGVIIDLLTEKIGDKTKAQALASKLLTIKQTPYSDKTNSATYNHAKVWIVDDTAFYVGSDNIYPGYLQEFGYIIGDKATCSQFITDYWDRVWSIGVPPTNG